MLFSMAWRNVWRSKTRSLVVIMAVAFGLFGAIATVGWMEGAMDQRVRTILNDEVGHIQVHHPDFLLNEEVSYVISDSKPLEKVLNQSEGVEAYSLRLKTEGMVATARNSAGIVLLGVDTLADHRVCGVYDKLVEGTAPTKGRIPGIMIGQKLADKLKARLKSKIVVSVSGPEGVAQGRFKVSGIYKTTNTGFDEMMAFVPRSTLQKLLALPEGVGHEMVIRLDDQERVKSVQDALQKAAPSLSVQSWKEVSPEIGLMVESMEQTAYILLIIILMALAFGIINTMMMVVLERVPELGMLMAIGMNKTRVFFMILLETVMLSLVGTVVGVLMSIGFVKYFEVHGIDMSMWAEGFEALGWDPIIYPVVSLKFYFNLTIMVLFTAFISSLWPSRKALQLNPQEAIRTI